MQQTTKQKMLFVLLLLVPFIWALSNSMIIPILPQAQRQLNISRFQSGLLITALSSPTAIFLPLTGFLSDRYGRVTIMFPAILLYGLSGLATGIAAAFKSYPLMIICRFFQGIGATGTSLLALCYVGDLYQNKNQAKYLSYLEAANSCGKLLGPIISNLTAQIVWYAPFFVYPILAVPISCCLLLFQVKTKCQQQQPPKLTQLVQQKKRLLLVASITTFSIVFLWFGNLFLLAEVVDSFNVTPTWQGFLLALPVLLMTLTTTIVGYSWLFGNWERIVY